MENEHLPLNIEPKKQPAPQTMFSVPPGTVAILSAVVIVVVVGILLHFISDAFLTFVAALFLANIFMPMVERLRRRRVPMVFAILVVLGIVGLCLAGVVVVAITTVGSVAEVVPKYEAKWDQVFLPRLIDLAGSISPQLKQQAIDFKFGSAIQPEKIMTAISSVTGLVSSFALTLLFMLFILASNGMFRLKLRQAFPPSGSFHLEQMVADLETRVRRYLLTTILINAAAAITMTGVLLLFGVDLAILWGVLTFLLMFIPSIGSIFAISIPLIVSFLQFDTLTTPIILSVIVIVSQLLIGSYIAPRVIGSTLNLSPLLILVSIIFWGWVWGPLGMILAVPITSTITIIFESIPPLRPLAVLMSGGPVAPKQE